MTCLEEIQIVGRPNNDALNLLMLFYVNKAYFICDYSCLFIGDLLDIWVMHVQNQ